MTPQEKCVSLETARRLKENNFPQETERVWFCIGVDKFELLTVEYLRGCVQETDELYAAPDSAELGELLPKGSMFVKYAGGWMDVTEGMPSNGNVNEAEARAAAWLYLKENNLL